MSVRYSLLIMLPGLRGSYDIRLRFDCTSAQEKLPVCFSCGDGEGGAVSYELSSLTFERECWLGIAELGIVN
jgi:hypothetical protein